MAKEDSVSEAALRRAMRDPRYWQVGHPERASHVAGVTAGWQALAARGDGESGSGLVHVRSYDRRRNGHEEHVSDYQQRRARGGGQQPSGTGAPPTRTPAASEAPAAAPAPSFIAFVGGGWDGTSNIVSNARRDLAPSADGRTTRYYSHQDSDRMIRDILAQQPGTRIVLVGHSWGGDTAAQVAARLGEQGRPVDLLVTVDPVGRGKSDDFYARVRAGTREWINVQATGGNWYDRENFVARMGDRYGAGPQPFATQHITAGYPHGDFRNMLTQSRPGAGSVLDRVLGR